MEMGHTEFSYKVWVGRTALLSRI